MISQQIVSNISLPNTQNVEKLLPLPGPPNRYFERTGFFGLFSFSEIETSHSAIKQSDYEIMILLYKTESTISEKNRIIKDWYIKYPEEK